VILHIRGTVSGGDRGCSRVTTSGASNCATVASAVMARAAAIKRSISRLLELALGKDPSGVSSVYQTTVMLGMANPGADVKRRCKAEGGWGSCDRAGRLRVRRLRCGRLNGTIDT
jgi:hypothetical protein